MSNGLSKLKVFCVTREQSLTRPYSWSNFLFFLLFLYSIFFPPKNMTICASKCVCVSMWSNFLEDWWLMVIKQSFVVIAVYRCSHAGRDGMGRDSGACRRDCSLRLPWGQAHGPKQTLKMIYRKRLFRYDPHLSPPGVLHSTDPGVAVVMDWYRFNK